jgi:HAD superfamily hydrolase (TIGR01549 family)
VYDSLLLDVDGVLLGFPPDPTAYRDASAAAFEAFGVSPSEGELAVFSGPAKTLDRMREVCRRHAVPFPELWAEHERRLTALQRRMMEGGERDLYEDHAALEPLSRGRGVALVSSNQQATVEFMVGYFGLSGYVDAVHGRAPTVEGFRRTKPDTHYVEAALADLGAGDALLVGDSVSDVLAAERAGLDSAFVRRPHREGYELTAEPTHEVAGLDELAALLEGKLGNEGRVA